MRIPALATSLGCVIFGITSGFVVSAYPLALVGVPAFVGFFSYFEQAVLILLVLRSSLDTFSYLSIPAIYAIGVDILTLLYLVVTVFQGRKIKCDRFWWFFAIWVMFQGLWVILLPLGGLGLDGSAVPDAIREWTRLFSWLMVYLLVMQLKDRVHPHKIISFLLLALVIPLLAGVLQMILPPAILAPIFDPTGTSGGDFSSRIKGTLGHPNTFATFLLLFISLVYWQFTKSRIRWLWLTLLGVLMLFYISTKAIFSLVLLIVFAIVLISPKLNITNILSCIILITLVLGLFSSTPYGQERLSSILQTPLINPDLPIDRAILLSETDSNSFNWRLAQWTYLLKKSHDFPLLGYGLGNSIQVSNNKLLPHNDYIRALIEGGIIGLVSYLVLFIAQIRHLFILFKNSLNPLHKNFCLCLLAIILAIPVGMITENIWSHTTLFFYWWTLFAIAGWDWNKYNPSN
ncbi:O-antigen ligase family protein [Calothrix sp. PCC 6303]|uniref:O-antigen ligase family protein n=1 Tax=Calothrix sp. PCC 6303 TaxID=1170562 RepID=UPI0002A03DA0|nr:O-antigen ligase family protein [Calothrix sp. PCC 6303]AFY99671.1 O-antigen polymerase [Calothrix sp. PCC 6303]